MTTVARDRAAKASSIRAVQTRSRNPGVLEGVPRLALTPADGAAALGMGLTSFKKYVQPYVRIIPRGKLRVIPVSELERWAEENAENVLGDPSQDRFSGGSRR